MLERKDACISSMEICIFLYLSHDCSCMQLEDGNSLFDYSVGLNEIIQLLIRSAPPPVATTAEASSENGTAEATATASAEEPKDEPMDATEAEKVGGSPAIYSAKAIQFFSGVSTDKTLVREYYAHL